jgi:putative ATP-dependent endonuclease of the OLD family
MMSAIKTMVLAALPENAKHRYLREILEGLSLALTEDRRLHGLGYHNLLFMGAELLLLEQEVKNEFPLLLIEDPEAHLHPQLQMKLLQFISSKVESAGVQCILTTHSPNISAKVSPADIIMLILDFYGIDAESFCELRDDGFHQSWCGDHPCDKGRIAYIFPIVT